MLLGTIVLSGCGVFMGTLATHPLGTSSDPQGRAHNYLACGSLLLIVLGAKMMLVDSQGEAFLKMGSNKTVGHNEIIALTA